MRVKLNAGKVCFVVFVFLYVFVPPIMPINMHMLIEILACIYFLLNILLCGWKNSINLRLIRMVGNFIPFWIYELTVLYYHLSVDSVNKVMYTDEFLLIFRLFLRLILILVVFCLYIDKNKVEYKEQLNNLKIIAFIQMIFVIATLFVPRLRTAILNLIIQNSSGTNVVDVYKRLSTRRAYGFAENLFDSFGYLLALFFALAFTSWLENGKKRDLFLSIMLVFACALNARTGVLLCAIAIVVSLIIYRRSFLHFKYIVLVALLFPIAYIVGIRILDSYFHNTFEWLQDGLNEVIMLVSSGEQIGTFEMLYKGIFWPNNLMIGAGASPEKAIGRATDVGYVQCVWRYGLVGTILFLVGYTKSVLNFFFFQKENRQYMCLMITIIVIMFVYLFKIFSINNISAHFVIFTMVLTGRHLNDKAVNRII